MFICMLHQIVTLKDVKKLQHSPPKKSIFLAFVTPRVPMSFLYFIKNILNNKIRLSLIIKKILNQRTNQC